MVERHWCIYPPLMNLYVESNSLTFAPYDQVTVINIILKGNHVRVLTSLLPEGRLSALTASKESGVDSSRDGSSESPEGSSCC